MRTIPTSYKKLLFNKEADEPLTDPEQAAWEEVLKRIQTPQKEVNIDDPGFITAMLLHYELKDKKKAAWEKLERELFPTNPETADTVVEIKAKKSSIRIPRWVWAAASIGIIITIIYLRYYNRKPGILIAGSDNELCSVTLPDGSNVQLNAESSIRYPEEFTFKERDVDLAGEAYFSVESDSSHPFRVRVDSTKSFTAVGTEFDVKSYREDSAIKVTLVKGVVWASNEDITKVVNVGEQAVLTGNQITINKKANMDNVLAWQHKFITFEGESLYSIMHQIQRFYKIKYMIHGNPPPLDINSRNVDASVNSLTTIVSILNDLIPEATFSLDKDSSLISVDIVDTKDKK
jgi:ferric-dicitrate binding protein FerR (iron transport regulator)